MKRDRIDRALETIQMIIAKDVRLIKGTQIGQKPSKKNGKLSADTALTLSRYAGTLNSIKDEAEKRKKKAKERFERENTAELVKNYIRENPSVLDEHIKNKEEKK